MALEDTPEFLLQRALHLLLADPNRNWTCTNGETIQVVAAGLLNVHEGPDFLDAAVLFAGSLLIGNIEFHVRSSSWVSHGHSDDDRYSSLLLHIVLEDDLRDYSLARWTLVVSHPDLTKSLSEYRQQKKLNRIALEELQHFALLRLLRFTAMAQTTLRRLGVSDAIESMTASFFDRLAHKNNRPGSLEKSTIIRQRIRSSKFGILVKNLGNIDPSDLFDHIAMCEKVSIAGEGESLRREVFINAILPLLCVRANHRQRVVLLQWYWSARSNESYGKLRRRFPEQVQAHVWQQQGMIEYLRGHGGKNSAMGEAVQEYGLANTAEFLDASDAH